MIESIFIGLIVGGLISLIICLIREHLNFGPYTTMTFNSDKFDETIKIREKELEEFCEEWSSHWSENLNKVWNIYCRNSINPTKFNFREWIALFYRIDCTINDFAWMFKEYEHLGEIPPFFKSYLDMESKNAK